MLVPGDRVALVATPPSELQRCEPRAAWRAHSGLMQRVPHHVLDSLAGAVLRAWLAAASPADMDAEADAPHAIVVCRRAREELLAAKCAYLEGNDHCAERRLDDCARTIMAWYQEHGAGWAPPGCAVHPDVSAEPAPTMQGPARPPVRVRAGQRVLAAKPDYFRAPTAKPITDALAIIGRGTFHPVQGQLAVSSEHNATRLQIECSEEFSPEAAIARLARYGPSVVQTYLAMAGLWLQRLKGAPYDTRLNVSVSDILRFMGRKPTSRGGFPNDDLVTRGKDVYLLANAWVPHALVATYGHGSKKTMARVTIDRLVVVESMSAQLPLDAADLQATVILRYHLSEAVHGYLCGAHPQYAEVSGRLLAYHPERQKYQVLLGFALSSHDRVNLKDNNLRSISLLALLKLAAVEADERNPARFLQTVHGAIADLAADGVVPGLYIAARDGRRLNCDGRPPEGVTARHFIAQAVVQFPPIRHPR